MDQTTRPGTITIVNCVLNAPLMLISIIGNSLVLSAILRTPTLHSPSTILLCSLAVSDLFVGLVVQPVYIASRLKETASLQQARVAIGCAACGVSLLTMTAISVDRFLALHYHMRYPNLMTTCRALYISAILWFITLLVCFLALWSLNALYFVIAVTIPICLLVSTVCYIGIYRIIRHHQLQIHIQQQAVQISGEENDQNMQRSNKSAINTFIFYIVMILCYTPLFIGMFVAAITPNLITEAWFLNDTIAFMNSSINPFLYCWRLRELRKEVVKTVRQILCKQTEEN